MPKIGNGKLAVASLSAEKTHFWALFFTERAFGAVAAPWAVDATGQSVPTRYEIEGQALVQVIDFTAATAFPVVADPDIIFFAKCAAGVALFIAENAAIAGKFWRVFKKQHRFLQSGDAIRPRCSPRIMNRTR